ncbi:riboflavin biosynthesis protein RibD C-terminal domain protein [Leptospira inadai serovar Lyme str. 10]|uniref:Riboflavin biosynthesis protein RibD C-terminal domain protein n=2 Tax=Leptospira inadai serovar Lyme TaxID=293084 RepID=V6HSL9_9LEPT|nr:dihydrofolate reductase family protein [Leptospira inadai]EQA35614.1 riboflavin biosynthesis protein RibD C-terminal domain protein [Leptospira inadai serovar Lyme str. 10]PNV71499.1 dihydrofolate reductase [Leptospira inadai serovar Lyme]
MRKVSLLAHASLDGFVGGPNGEMDWISHDDEIFRYVTEHFKSVDTCLYGRVVYQMMESYWPTVSKNPAATKMELHHADWVENIQKIVFSTTLEKAEWNNTRLVKSNVAEEISKLKKQPGKNMMIFGSPRLTHSFMQMGLIDEFVININPVILGNGIPLFKESKDKIDLKLINSTTFKCGVVGLHLGQRTIGA